MAKSIPFGARTTADQVLAGIDLSGKRYVVTGCNSGIGFETMSALTANGGQVLALARTLPDAKAACDKVSPGATPLACDLADLESVAAAAAAIRAMPGALDAIVANAGIAHLPTLQTRYGVEMQFLVNHIGHFALLNDLADLVRDATGRIVVVSSGAAAFQASIKDIMFDNLDGNEFYKPNLFYGQSKLANGLFAKELSRRLSTRGIAVNSLHPGATRGTALNRSVAWPVRIALTAAQAFMKSTQQGASTQALLAASPQVSGITGEFWTDCQIAKASLVLADGELATRLWRISEDIVARQRAQPADSLRRAA